MNIRYITIEREFGSGGTKIARCLSESTGIPCYGKEILENASKKLKKAKWNVFENGSIREEPGIIMPILHERGMKGLFQKQSQGLSISR